MLLSRRTALLCLSCLLAIGAFAGFAGSASAAPFNDNFADADFVKGNSYESFSSLGDATREDSEPTVPGSDTDHTIWFRWVAQADGFLRVSGCGDDTADNPLSNFSMGVYTGNAVDSLTQRGQGTASCGQSGVFAHTGPVPVVAGTTYYVQAGYDTADDGDDGEITFDFAPSVPVNDDWDDATVLQAGLPQSISSSNRLAIVSNETDLNALRRGGNSVWYSWTPSQSGTVSIDTCSSSSIHDDSILEVFDDNGVQPAALNTLGSVSYDDDGCRRSGNLSYLTMEVTSGKQYWLRVANYSNVYGMEFTLKLQWLGAFTNVVAPTVSNTYTQPGDTMGSNNGNWWSPNLISYSHQWQRCDAVGTNCVDIPGATADGIGVSADDLGHTLRFALTADDGDDTITAFSKASFPVGTQAPNDYIADAADLGATSVVRRSQTNLFTGREGNEYNSVPQLINSTVWFKWTAPTTGSTTVGTCLGTDPAPQYPLAATIGVHTGYDGVTVDSVSRVASASDNCGGGDHGASVQFSATAGTTYWIQVGSSDDDWGQFTLKLNAPVAAAVPPVVPPVDPFPSPSLKKLGTIKLKKGKLSLKKLNVTCGATATGPCTGALTIKTAKTKVKGKTVKSVSQSFKLNVKPGTRLNTTFKPNKKLLAAIKKAKKLKATVSIKLGAPGFSQKTGRTSATLKS